MSVGLQAAQAAHAAFEFSVKYPEMTKRWHDESNYLILLSVPDEDDLLQWQEKAEAQGLRTHLVREPDLNDEATSLAVEPHPAAQQLFSSLPLLGREVANA